jgi:ABC-2 type transport system permease protein
MISDVAAIVWKEWRELLGERGLRGKSAMLATLGVFGVMLPLEFGRAWITSPGNLLAWSWMPMFLVSGVIADGIAGERERHTLETLLASRLPDRAILLGKMAAAIGYAAIMTVTSLVLGAITLNVVLAGHGIVFYSLPVLAVVLFAGFGAAVLVAAGGTLISLHAPTVRQAFQMLGTAVVVALFAPVFLFRALPLSWKAELVGSTDHLTMLIIAGVAALVLADVIAVAILVGRFRRPRLVGV